MYKGCLVRYKHDLDGKYLWLKLAAYHPSVDSWTATGSGEYIKNAGAIGIVVDIVGRNHRKAIIMNDNKFFIISLKHLEQVSKLSLSRKRTLNHEEKKEEQKTQ